MAKENIVENTLFQLKNLEESLKKNAQGILSSTMKKEINSLVKESLMEQEEVTEPAPEEMPTDLPVEGDVEMTDPNMMAMGGMEDPSMMDPNMMAAGDMEEPMSDDETVDMTEASDEEVIRVFKAMGDNDGVVVTRDNNIITLTDDDDEYIIKLNESMENFEEINMEEDLYEMDDFSFEDDDMSMDDEDDDMSMDDEDDYMSFDDEDDYMSFEDEDDDMSFEDEDDDMSFEDEEDDMSFEDEEDEIIYELEMNKEPVSMEETPMYEEDDMDFSFDDEEEDDFELYESKSFKPKGNVGKLKKVDFKSNTVGGFNEKRKEAFGGKLKAHGTGKAKFTYKDGENLDGEYKIKPKSKKVETKEASRFVKSVDRKVKRGLMAAPSQLKEEVVELRTKNQEYRKALDLFRTKLNEVAVFNSNLAYATRLFTEHSTTKQEKINILRRFDDVETLKESKNLYRVVKNELSNGTLNEGVSLNESVQRTVNNSVSSGSAVNLIESKTYENPQFLRMKDLMTKIK